MDFCASRPKPHRLKPVLPKARPPSCAGMYFSMSTSGNPRLVRCTIKRSAVIGAACKECADGLEDDLVFRGRRNSGGHKLSIRADVLRGASIHRTAREEARGRLPCDDLIPAGESAEKNSLLRDGFRGSSSLEGEPRRLSPPRRKDPFPGPSRIRRSASAGWPVASRTCPMPTWASISNLSTSSAWR